MRPSRLEIRALNQPHIASAFGREAAEATRDAMMRAVSGYLLAEAAILESPILENLGLQSAASGPASLCRSPLCRSHDDLVIVDLPACPPVADMALLIEGLSRALVLEPVILGDARIHVAPQVSHADSAADISSDPDEAVLTPVEPVVPFGGDPVVHGGDWAHRYRSDMAAAAQLIADLAADRLSFARQPIRLAGRAQSLLYSECLLRAPQLGEAVRHLGLEIVAMERLGLIRVLDNHVMRRALDRLRADPELRLGVNISAQSACRDGWWEHLERRLAAEPSLAQRLTIEITETSTIPSIPAAIAFVDRMRKLGCRIALDDFGVGRDAIRNLFALRPDIVKVDAFFLRQARQSENGRAALKALVGLARAIGRAVVVEGIETQADSDTATAAGAAWQQGYFIDLPAREPAEGGNLASAESPPVFGRRQAPPQPEDVESGPDAARAGGAKFARPIFELWWLRWAIPLSAIAWVLMSGGIWLVWRAAS